MNSLSKNAARAVSGAVIAGVCALALAACGGGGDNDVPSNAVAVVGDTVITKQQLARLVQVAAKSAQQQQQGAPPPSPAQLRQQALGSLIQTAWIEQEAANQGIKLTDAEVRALFEQQKKQVFPKEKDYEAYLKRSGTSERELLNQVRITALQNKLTEKIQRSQKKVTDEDIQAFYDKNKARLAQPATHDLNVVVTRTEAKANEAKQQLDEGSSFAAVAKKYSIDPISRAAGGKLPGVPTGQVDRALDAAIATAPRGKIVGPVETQAGWYVFAVTGSRPAMQQTLAQAKESIRSQLQAQGGQKALQDFVKDFQERFKAETRCRKGYVIALCASFKDPRAAKTTTVPPGGVQQGEGGGTQPPLGAQQSEG